MENNSEQQLKEALKEKQDAATATENSKSTATSDSFSKEDDTDMPKPKTRNYTAEAQQRQQARKPSVEIYLKPAFAEELKTTLGNLGYSRELGIPERHVQIFQLFDILNNFKERPMTEPQLNEFLNLISLAPYNIVAGLMNKLRNPKEQKNFWLVKQKQSV